MFIQTEATPNPATLKFLPGRTVLDGTLDITDREQAAKSPLAEKLFAFMIERKASDLHISTGNPPILRIDGVIVPLGDRAVMGPADHVGRCARAAASATAIFRLPPAGASSHRIAW